MYIAEKNPTTGITPIQDKHGNIVPGSEFKIKVNNEMDRLTFFVLSNDGKYVNLIAQQNITSTGMFTSEPQDGDEWYAEYWDNGYGPQTAYTYLSNATSNWTNIPIIENFYYEDEGYKQNPDTGYQSIKTELDKLTGKHITTITLYSSDYGSPKTYENMRTRLPYVSEITENTSCERYSSSPDSLSQGSCPLWLVNYLYNSDYYTSEKKINSVGSNYGYWLLSAGDTINGAINVHCTGSISGTSNGDSSYGVRPVIVILKSDLLRVMK